MQRLIVFAILAIAVAYALEPSLDTDWAEWKKTHSRTYDIGEDVHRRAVWEDNLALIKKHNSEYKLGKHTYTLGMNHFGDMTKKEINIMLNGYREANTTQSRRSLLESPMKKRYDDLPDHVDWRDHGYVTEVKDQGLCHSSWAFSAIGALEGAHFRSTGKLLNLSVQQLVDCNTENDGCNGGISQWAYDYIQVRGGVEAESSYPYEATEFTCRFDGSNVVATCSSYETIAVGDEEALKQVVADIGPVSAVIDASSLSFQLYQSGVYSNPECSSSNIDLSVLVVGYGTDTDGGDYWLVKNSWGTRWGMQGYIKMARNKGNMCGIASKACYPLV